jgi:hypothetical protein
MAQTPYEDLQANLGGRLPHLVVIRVTVVVSVEHDQACDTRLGATAFTEIRNRPRRLLAAKNHRLLIDIASENGIESLRPMPENLEISRPLDIKYEGAFILARFRLRAT